MYNFFRMALSTITSDEPITLPSVFCTKNYSHLQSSLVGIFYFLTALPWEFIYAKLRNLTISIQNFHIDHNVPYLPPPPQKKKNCITIVFDLPWDDCSTEDKLETIVIKNVGE